MTPELMKRIENDLHVQGTRPGPPPGFPALPEIPAGRYIDEKFYDLEMEHIWKKSWLMAAREEDVAKPGDYMLFKKLGPSVVIVRGKDNVVRAFYNTCKHRGAKLVKDECGSTRLLRCQYHSWAYDFEGKLVNVPDEEDFCGLDREASALTPVKCATWGGWIFLNFDMNAGSLEEAYGPLFAEWNYLNMKKLRIIHRFSQVIDCNWKAAVDAFQETYHLRTIHAPTIGKALNYKACSIGLLPGGHSRMITDYHPWAKETLGLDAPDTPQIPEANDLLRHSSSSWFAFPHIVTPFRFTCLTFQIYWPISVNQCELQLIGIGPDWGEGEPPAFWEGANKRFQTVLAEDWDNLFSIQQSMESGVLSGMRLNYQERRLYWTHEEIDRRIGVDRIPAQYRVKPMLGSWVEEPMQLAAE